MCKERSGSEERQSVSAIISTQITSIVHIIFSVCLCVCSNVYSSYLVVRILTNYYYFLLSDRLNILFSNPYPHTYTLS